MIQCVVLFNFFFFFCAAVGSQFLDQGSDSCPLQWMHTVLPLDCQRSPQHVILKEEYKANISVHWDGFQSTAGQCFSLFSIIEWERTNSDLAKADFTSVPFMPWLWVAFVFSLVSLTLCSGCLQQFLHAFTSRGMEGQGCHLPPSLDLSPVISP